MPLVLLGMIAVFALLIGLSFKKVHAYIETLDKSVAKLIAAGYLLLALLVISIFQGFFEARQVERKNITHILLLQLILKLSFPMIQPTL